MTLDISELFLIFQEILIKIRAVHIDLHLVC